MTTRSARAIVVITLLLGVEAAHASPLDLRAARPGVTADDDGDGRLARRKNSGKKAGKPAPAPEPGAQPEPTPQQQQAAVDQLTRRGPTRVEFDERLLQGQTNKANAIYLFQRRESALRSLVKKRQHFHEEIDEALE